MAGASSLAPTVALDVTGKGNFSTAAQTPLLDSISGALAIGTTTSAGAREVVRYEGWLEAVDE